MNHYTLELTSDSSSAEITMPQLDLNDTTTVTISLSAVYKDILPTLLTIDWGDGELETFDNDVFRQGREHVNISNKNPILTETQEHIYYPSETALYKSMTLQIMVTYSNGEAAIFTVPVQVRTYDYYESVYDISLKNTNILPVESNSKEYQLVTGIDGFLIEMVK